MNTIKLNTIGLDDVIVKNVGSSGGGGAATMIETTWEELKALRDGGQLNAGAMYRITDYETMTSKGGSQSAGHLFDLVVTALSASELDEKCSAVNSARDTEGYFANSNLNAWDVRYCLDNDNKRFEWAAAKGKSIGVDLSEWELGIINFLLDGTFDYNGTTYIKWVAVIDGLEAYSLTASEDVSVGDTVLLYNPEIHEAMGDWIITSVNVTENEGKGVIYRLIDEYWNDVPYDFKNLQFVRKITNGELDLENGIDTWCYTFTSINEGNLLDESFNTATSNVFGVLCWDNVYIGNNCYRNTFGDSCINNTFGKDCQNNTFREHFYNNTFGKYCKNNTFGEGFSSNTFGDSCSNNTFGAAFRDNTFGDGCRNSTFGHNFRNNTFGNTCRRSTFGDECYRNTFGHNFSNSTLGDYCSDNTFGEHCYRNNFGHYCQNNTFGRYCQNNTFGNECYSNTFEGYCSKNTLGDYCKNNTLRENCDNNTFGNNCSYSSFSKTKVTNVIVRNNVSGTATSPLTLDVVANVNYTQTVAYNSSGELKIYCEADLVQ